MAIKDKLTPQFLKDTMLLGVDLTLDDGTQYPDIIYTQSIDAAIRHVENDLGISISPFRVIEEGHDAERHGRYSYWPFRLDHRPVISYQAARIRFGSFQPVDIPTSWIKSVSHRHGQIHLIPSEESLGSYFFRAGVPLMGGYGIYESRDYIPSYFEFSYTAGFDERSGSVIIPAGETSATITLTPRVLGTYTITTTAPDGVVVTQSAEGQDSFVLSIPSQGTDTTISWVLDTIPSDLLQAIAIKSSTLLLLHVAGDLIIGAGIAQQSLSVDGLSQSVDTTSSAMYSGYSARAQNLDNQYQLLVSALKAQYKITQFGVV